MAAVLVVLVVLLVVLVVLLVVLLVLLVVLAVLVVLLVLLVLLVVLVAILRTSGPWELWGDKDESKPAPLSVLSPHPTTSLPCLCTLLGWQ